MRDDTEGRVDPLQDFQDRWQAVFDLRRDRVVLREISIAYLQGSTWLSLDISQ